MNDYYSGWPYSDELYHHGTKGQKWGERRYQYEDGSLTPLGRIHYGVGRAGEVIGRGAKKVGNVLATRYKRKHPGMMNDEELTAEITRQRKLNELKRAREEGRKGSPAERASEILWKSTETLVKETAKSYGTNLGQKFVDKMFESSSEKKLKEIENQSKITKALKESFDKRNEYNEVVNKYNNERKAERMKVETQKKAEREAEKIKAKVAAENKEIAKAAYEARRESAHADVEARRRMAEKKQIEAARRREEIERLKRKAKYGPGGSAYK